MKLVVLLFQELQLKIQYFFQVLREFYENFSYNKKRKTLKRAFTAYLREENNIPANYRFDVVEIDLPDCNSSNMSIFHHENIAIF